MTHPTTQTLTIEGTGFGGEGYVQIEPGRFISVPHTLKGDVVEARVGPLHRGRAWGVVEVWRQRSAGHVDPGCAHYDRCSGCALRHISLVDELAWKRDAVRQILERYGPASCRDLPIDDVCAGRRAGHRARGRFRVSEVDGEVRVGLQSLELDRSLIDIRRCPAQAPAFIALMGEIAELLGGHPEAARGVEAVELWTQGDEALAILSCGPGVRGELAPALRALAEARGMALGFVEGDEVEMLRGEAVLPVIHEVALGGASVRVEPPVGSWVHATPEAAGALLGWVTGRLQGRGHRAALDVCCGTGTLTFHLSGLVERVVAIDEDHRAVEAIVEAARRAGIEGIEGRAGRAGAVLRKLRQRPGVGPRPTLATVNPMRRPLGGDQLRDLPALGVEQILYLGPAPASAARDAVILDAMGFAPIRAAAVNLHPATAQVMLAIDWVRR